MVEPGQHFGDFVVTRVLTAEGPTVALATQDLTGRKCILHVFERADPVVLEAARVPSRVADARILGAGALPEPWIAFEVAGGRDLAEFIRSTGPLPPASARDLFIQLCGALRSIHDAGLAHGALKPEVIWLEQKSGQPMSVRIGEVALAAGTAQADVFALAQIAFFVLVGQWPPPAGSIPASLLARNLHSPLALSSSFDAWFARCIQADPVLRFASGGDCEGPLLYALDDVARQSPVAQVISPGGSPYRTQPQRDATTGAVTPRASRSRLWMLLGTLFVMLGVLGVVAATAPKTTKMGTVSNPGIVRREGFAPALVIPAHFGPVFSLAMLADGKTAVSLSMDDTLKFWNVNTGAQERVLSPNFGRGATLAVTTNGILAAGGGGVVKVWSLKPEPKLLVEIPAHAGQVTGVALVSDGSVLVSSSFDGALKSWQLPAGTLLHEMKGHRGRVLSVSLSADSERVVSAGDDGTVRVWSLKTGLPLRSIAAHDKPISCVRIAADGQTIATASDDGTTKLIHADSGEVIRTFPVSNTEVWSVAFTPSGRTLAIGDKEGLIYLYSVFSGERLRVLTGHASGALSLAFAPDGEVLVSGGGDRAVRVWRNFL
jgi:WD40 repeat protein